jgi:hypothetical protein
MSEAAGTRALWIAHGSPARDRLRKVVADLTRARRLQVLLDHGFGGLLAGLGLATIAVLVCRLAPLPYPPWQPAGAAVIIALAVALLMGWRRRPAALEVAIRADLMLKLKQRLSTAWEFMTVQRDGELAERLAVQAVNAGLSARPGMVFPPGVNRYGRLAPLAAMALLLASVVDLDRLQAPPLRKTDEQVVGEGRRLGAFGREMQARAKRGKLPRSERQAVQLERLGARMESGALSRDEALGQLRRMGASLDEERMQALAEAKPTDNAPSRAESGERSPVAPGPDLGAMLERMQRGALDSGDARALAGRLGDLERSGIPRQQMENALARHRAGADDALREILENLARIDRGRGEQQELSGAREQVRRTRENLGESLTDDKRDLGTDIDWDDDEERGARSAAQAQVDGRAAGKSAHEASRSAPRRDPGAAADRQPSAFRQDSGGTGPVMKPQGQVREGEEFATQGRVSPRPGRPGVENVKMASEFAAQVEEVLSRDQYPPHHKEFVRRYFLTLSQGVRGTQPQSPHAREAP